MPTARLLPVSQHALLGGVYLVPGGVPGRGVYLVLGGVPGPREVYLVPGGVPAHPPWTETHL